MPILQLEFERIHQLGEQPISNLLKLENIIPNYQVRWSYQASISQSLFGPDTILMLTTNYHPTDV